MVKVASQDKMNLRVCLLGKGCVFKGRGCQVLQSWLRGAKVGSQPVCVPRRGRGRSLGGRLASRQSMVTVTGDTKREETPSGDRCWSDQTLTLKQLLLIVKKRDKMEDFTREKNT